MMGQISLHHWKGAALWGGPALFTAVLLSLGGSGDKAAAALGTALWMGLWWIVRPVHIVITALLPIAVNALFDMVPMEHVLSPYFSEIIVLIVGADMLCLSWTETGLDRRMALKILCLLGTSLRQQIAVWLIVSAAMSVFLPNVAVCALLTPVAISMLKAAGEERISSSQVAVPILLAIVWGAGIGGVGSPLGGAANLVTIQYLEKLTRQEFMYIDWFSRFLPFLFCLVLLNLTILIHIPVPSRELSYPRSYFRKRYSELGAMTGKEWLSLVLFLTGAALAFSRPLYAAWFPAMKPAYVFLLFAMACFFIRDRQGTPLLTWEKTEKQIMWGLLILFGGGLALGTVVTETGAALQLADGIRLFPLAGGAGTILVVTLFGIGLSEISSNTAAAAIAMPIVESLTLAIDAPPVPYLLIATAAVNTAYMLPISIRAIPVSCGLDGGLLFRYGVIASLLSAVVITLLGWGFIVWWPGFGQW